MRGARQTGKTILAKAVCAQDGRSYVTFDSVTTMTAAQADPVGFVRGLDKPVVIDEIQRVPELFLPIKQDIDENRSPGRYFLAGSANPLALADVADSLAGRMETLTLHTLSQGEIAGERDDFIAAMFAPEFDLGRFRGLGKTRETIFSTMVVGGYPEILTRAQPERRSAWHESYLTALVERDVRDLAHIQDRGALLRLFSLLAAKSGTLYNSSDIARAAGLNGASITRYTTMLETLFLVWFLSAWSVNLGKRMLSKSSKANFTDIGFACHLCGADEKRLNVDSFLASRLFESFVVGEICKQSSWSDENARLYHYRSQNGDEVDLVLENRAGRVVGMELKLTGTVSPLDYKGLIRMREALGERFVRSVLAYAGSDAIPLEEKLFAVPVAALHTENSV